MGWGENFEYFQSIEETEAWIVCFVVVDKQDEEERVGWFPLNRRSSRLIHLAAGDKITGSVQLRVRWIHSLKALLRCRVQALEVGTLIH